MWATVILCETPVRAYVPAHELWDLLARGRKQPTPKHVLCLVSDDAPYRVEGSGRNRIRM